MKRTTRPEEATGAGDERNDVSEAPKADEDVLEVMPLGGGSEVGRSCILIKFKGKQILLDCGIHPAYTGQAGLPFFDMIDDISEIDLLLVSHFHLDHVGSLPYLLERTPFKGRVFMTHPTKAVYRMLMQDYVRVSSGSSHDEEQLFSEEELERSMQRVEVVHYHQRVQCDGITFEALSAGHVLGAAQFIIEISGLRLLYTGDYSREEDRHLCSAELPRVKPDVLIVEATYGVQMHEPQQQREARLIQAVAECVLKGGKALMPVFALGRAQELLLLLEETWEQSPHLRHIPVFFVSQMAKKALNVFSTYITYMNDRIRKQALVKNPFAFKYVQNLNEGAAEVMEPTPCVVMASPGMLQSGYSRQLLEAWCEDPRNAVLITGYSVEGTMAKLLQTDPLQIEARDGRRLQRRCRVETVSFSAHCDFLQTSEFIDLVKPQHIVLVHGEKNQMTRLQDALTRKYNQQEQVAKRRQQAQASGAAAPTDDASVSLWRPQQIYSPENCNTVSIAFPAQGKVRVVGQVAETVPGIGHAVGGVLVRRDFETLLMDPADLPAYSNLQAMQVACRVAIPMPHMLLASFIQAVVSVWTDVTVNKPEDPSAQPEIVICGRIRATCARAIPTEQNQGDASAQAQQQQQQQAEEDQPADPRKRRKKKEEPAPQQQQQQPEAAAPKPNVEADATKQECLVLEWSAGVVDDMIADSVAAIACQCCVGPWSVLQQGSEPHRHGDEDHDHGHDTKKRRVRDDCVDILFHFLVGFYGPELVKLNKDGGIEIALNQPCLITYKKEDGTWDIAGDDNGAIRKHLNNLIAQNVLMHVESDVL